MTTAVGFRLGDVVEIVGETDGGLIRGRALVLGETDPGWFAGELEGGEKVEFHESQVEGLAGGQYGMSGFMDWFRKKPEAPKTTALVPYEDPAAVIYVGPGGVAKYEAPAKKKGFFKPITETVKRFFGGAEGGPSIFDGFRTKTTLIPEPEKGAIPAARPESFFSQFGPPGRVMEKAISFFSMPEGSESALAPYREREEAEAGPQKPPVQQELREVFAQDVGPEEPSLEDMAHELAPKHVPQAYSGFVPYRESEIVSRQEYDLRNPFNYDRGLNWEPHMLDLPPRNTMLPSVEDVARGFLTTYNMGEVFADIYAERKSALEGDDGSACEFTFPIVTLGSGESIPNYLEGISYFLQISWDEFLKRASEYSLDENGQFAGLPKKVWREIVYPSYRIIEEALSRIAPPELPGSFMVGDREAMDGPMISIYYVDSPYSINDPYEEGCPDPEFFNQAIDMEEELSELEEELSELEEEEEEAGAQTPERPVPVTVKRQHVPVTVKKKPSKKKKAKKR